MRAGLFYSGAQRVPEVQQLPALTHYCVPRRCGRRPAAQRGQLRSATDSGFPQSTGARLLVSVGFGCFFVWMISERLLEGCYLTVPRPKLTVVVVKKRISSRFFTLFGGKTTNPPPGTVIDTEVTRPEWWVTATSVFREGFHAAGITSDMVYFYCNLATDLWNPANLCHLFPGMIFTS